MVIVALKPLALVAAQDDLIGVLPRSGATAADVPDLRPLSDRVLLQVLLGAQCFSLAQHSEQVQTY